MNGDAAWSARARASLCEAVADTVDVRRGQLVLKGLKTLLMKNAIGSRTSTALCGTCPVGCGSRPVSRSCAMCWRGAIDTFPRDVVLIHTRYKWTTGAC